MSLKLTREAELAKDWGLPIEQMRLLRRRHGWAHVRFSRQDIRYSDAQIAQIVRDQTTKSSPRQANDSGQTARSAARAS